jgi:hypothetical protein
MPITLDASMHACSLVRLVLIDKRNYPPVHELRRGVLNMGRGKLPRQHTIDQSLSTESSFTIMSTTSSSARSIFTGRPLSCISGLDPGSDCGQDNWDLSPNSGFYTICCDGRIVDFTGYNSYFNYTLMLENLLCCQHEDPDLLSSEEKKCANGAGTPLSSLLATSTAAAKPWTTSESGAMSTVNAQCFWSQLAPDAVATTAISSSSATFSARTISSSSLDAGSSSAASLSNSATVTSDVPTEASTTAAAAGLAVTVALPPWMIPVILLLSFGLQL